MQEAHYEKTNFDCKRKSKKKWKYILKNKKFYLLSAGAAPEEKYMQTMINSFHQYISCFRAGENEEGGILFAYGTNGSSDIKTMSVLEGAYQMGKEV